METVSQSQAEINALVNSCLQRIATGPTMSKDLSRDEARQTMAAILADKVDPVQSAVFLIALRMKRETPAELRGVLDAICSAFTSTTAPVDELIDLADPYDGYVRHVPASPFLPAVLAACGVPAISHGLRSVAPKYGVTHHLVLEKAGINVGMNPTQASERLADPDIGWSYIDQQVYLPALHNLVELRRLIVKRSCITTLETLAGPIHANNRTHVVTGYVHKDYAAIYTDLARHAGFFSALVIRGIEGGVIPLLNKSVICNSYHDNKPDKTITLNPDDADISADERGVFIPEGLYDGDNVDITAVTELAAHLGLQALEGKPGLIRESLVYAAATCLMHVKRHTSWSAAAAAAREAIDSGNALQRFRA